MAMPYASLSPAGADHRSSTATASLLPFCRSSPLSAGDVGGGRLGYDAQMSGRWAAARSPPFTAAQYEELEQQALIYKYLVAGVPVPPDLVLPIRRGLDSLATRFYGHPTLGYGSYFGKKLDREPGRCRRTDGKKWRCSKEAAPDSKYCERHMHRGRNRSRKPVETQLVPQSQPPATAATPLAVATNSSNFQNHSLYPAIAGSTGAGGASYISRPFSSSLVSAQLHMDNAASYAALSGGTGKDVRYTAYGIRSLADEHSQLITEAIDSSMENQWRLPPSHNSPFPLSSYPQLGALSDLCQNTVDSLSKMDRQPLSFLGSEFGTVDSVKQENQTLRPFFDEWPKARDSWSGLADENANLSFSATQLSISIPMASSDFSVASSQSPNGD
ncbi:growth-regulating factor 4-like [Phragmites australis]|uniref:growth-regulating factor 4-like n=1 Tax=Phragmites australis TaxID=29695 RepID=UPI002D7972E7|nr:growth-regulating factor 4-like [Phragmites australis]